MSVLNYMLPPWRFDQPPRTCRQCGRVGRMIYGTSHGWFCDVPCRERWTAMRALSVETGRGIGDDDHWFGSHLLGEWAKRQVDHVSLESYHDLLGGMERMVIELSPALRETHYDADGIPREWKKCRFDRLREAVNRYVDEAETVLLGSDMRAPTACGW